MHIINYISNFHYIIMKSIFKPICAYFLKFRTIFPLINFQIFYFYLSRISLSLFNCHLQQLQQKHWPTNLCFGQHFWPIAAAVTAALLATRNWQRAVGAIGNWQPVYAAQIIANRLTASWVESLFFCESSSKLQFD